jgi:hypothetical protein
VFLSAQLDHVWVAVVVVGRLGLWNDHNDGHWVCDFESPWWTIIHTIQNDA